MLRPVQVEKAECEVSVIETDSLREPDHFAHVDCYVG